MIPECKVRVMLKHCCVAQREGEELRGEGRDRVGGRKEILGTAQYFTLPTIRYVFNS